jgi:hypothetical protein
LGGDGQCHERQEEGQGAETAQAGTSVKTG